MTWGEFLGIVGVAAIGGVGSMLFGLYVVPHLARFLTKVEAVPSFAVRRPHRVGLFRVVVALLGAAALCFIMFLKLSTDDEQHVGNGDFLPPLITSGALLALGIAVGRLWWVRSGRDAAERAPEHLA